MATPYEKVYRSFLLKIEDVDLLKFDEEEQNEMLTGWLNEALLILDMRNINIECDLSLKNDELQEFEADLSNVEVEIIAMLMVSAWLTPRVNSLEHILLMTGSSGEKWTSQKEHLNSMKELRDYWVQQAVKLCRDRNTTNNSYFD